MTILQDILIVAFLLGVIPGGLVWLPIFIAYMELLEARRACERGEKPEWIEINGSLASEFFVWGYCLVAWYVGAKCERGERIGINGAAGMVIPNFRYKLLRYIPK